jgi:hypothetical protein
MKTTEANELLDKAMADIAKNGINAATQIPLIKEAREYALKEEDPLVTRALRLAWQHVEENKGFLLAYLEESESQDENYEYFLTLCRKSENEHNRNDLREMTNLLQQMA